MMARLKRPTGRVVGIRLLMQARQDITVGSHIMAALYQYTLQDGNVAALIKWPLFSSGACVACRNSET